MVGEPLCNRMPETGEVPLVKKLAVEYVNEELTALIPLPTWPINAAGVYAPEARTVPLTAELPM